MGAVFYSVDVRLIDRLQRALPLRVFVETGSFHGDSVAIALERFGKIYSVEQSPELYRLVAQRFAGRPAVTIIQGDSAAALAQLHTELRAESVFYWLDAHWCAAEHTVNQDSQQCAVMGELLAIGALNPLSVVAIDDARLFLCPPKPPYQVSHFPHLHELTAALARLSSRHRMMVVNDVVLFYPLEAEAALDAYAVEDGLDWNQALQACRGQIDAVLELDAKEKMIRDLEAAAADRLEALQRKEAERSSLAARLAIAERGLLWRVAILTAQRLRRLTARTEA